MTVDSIRNSCNVFIPSLKSVIYRVIFCNWPPQFQYQEENLQSANHSLFYLPDLLEQQVWLADWRFSFWYWNWRGQLKKSPCIIVIKIRELIRYEKKCLFFITFIRDGWGVGVGWGGQTPIVNKSPANFWCVLWAAWNCPKTTQKAHENRPNFYKRRRGGQMPFINFIKTDVFMWWAPLPQGWRWFDVLCIFDTPTLQAYYGLALWQRVSCWPPIVCGQV